MAMTDLEQLIDSGLPLTWGTIWIGWRGPSLHPPVVSTGEVISYATDRLSRGVAEECAGYVVDLASVEASDAHAVEEALRCLALLEGLDADTETLKWEVVLLRKLLRGLGSDPVDALMELTHFWSLFDYPAHSPRTIQGVGNSIAPEDYYTQENLALALGQHYKWLEACESELRAQGYKWQR